MYTVFTAPYCSNVNVTDTGYYSSISQHWTVFLSVAQYIFQGTGHYSRCEQLIDNFTNLPHEPPAASGDYIVSGL